jgi:hypothetical protein
MGEVQMGFLLKGVAVTAIACMSLPSFAATLQPIEAEVFVNHGSGFQKVTVPTQANVGDTVMAGPVGAAQLVYEDGCKVSINPGGVVAVQELSPCLANAHAAELALPAAPAVEYYDPSAYYGIGAAALATGGVITAGILLSRKHHNPVFFPASP